VRTAQKTSIYREAADRREERPDLVTELHPVGFELERCPVCRGTFLDAGELERLESAGERRGRWAESERAGLVTRAFAQARRPEDGSVEAERPPLDCPKCDGTMFEREWSIGTMVRVDVCIDCRGVWLDEGELETLARLYGSKPREQS
jgi:Zn-finger nucleic acid-binding protein